MLIKMDIITSMHPNTATKTSSNASAPKSSAENPASEVENLVNKNTLLSQNTLFKSKKKKKKTSITTIMTKTNVALFKIYQKAIYLKNQVIVKFQL